jgi:glycine dehydrogenase subunit 1
MSYIKNIVYLYIPNSVPAKKEEMLRVVNARSVEELYGDITESIRFKCKINLPKPLLAEAELVQYIEELLGKNTNARE